MNELGIKTIETVLIALPEKLFTPDNIQVFLLRKRVLHNNKKIL